MGKSRKNGFTLVELIVVLVILAILAALLVPALTGYIDKARQSAVIAETRSVLQAVQTEVSELYGKNEYAEQVQAASIFTIASKDDNAMPGGEQKLTGLKARYDEIVKLAEVPSLTNGTGKFFCLVETSGKVYLLVYDDGKGEIGIYFAETQEYVAVKTSEGYNIDNYGVYVNRVVSVSRKNAGTEEEKTMWSKENVLRYLKA